MGSSSSLQSEEHLLCSICRDVFTDPISTPCGHNYCQACITHYWDTSGSCHCPLCNKTFPHIPEFSVNEVLSKLVDQFRKEKHKGSGTKPEPAKPDEVSCDFCTEPKLKALKSCLVCLASYCETHLEPHLRLPHKLIDPVKNLEDITCQKHDRPLELSCQSDHKSEVQQMIWERQGKICKVKLVPQKDQEHSAPIPQRDQEVKPRKASQSTEEEPMEHQESTPAEVSTPPPPGPSEVSTPGPPEVGTPGPPEVGTPPPPGPPEVSVPLSHFVYLNQAFREEMQRIERDNGVTINAEVKVSFVVDPKNNNNRPSPHPDRARHECTDLIQKCSGDLDSVTVPPSQEDWRRVLQSVLLRDESRLVLRASHRELTVSGPLKIVADVRQSLPKPRLQSAASGSVAASSSERERHIEAREIGMPEKDPTVSAGLSMHQIHWTTMQTMYGCVLANIMTKYNVSLDPEFAQDEVTVRVKSTGSGSFVEANSLESHAFRALLRLYQKVVMSSMAGFSSPQLSHDPKAHNHGRHELPQNNLQGPAFKVPRLFGYPDDNYLSRVRDELNAKGIK